METFRVSVAGTDGAVVEMPRKIFQLLPGDDPQKREAASRLAATAYGTGREEVLFAETQRAAERALTQCNGATVAVEEVMRKRMWSLLRESGVRRAVFDALRYIRQKLGAA